MCGAYQKTVPLHVKLFCVHYGLCASPRLTTIPQIDRWWLLFFPNDLRCGFRKLKERGVGNRTSGAALVPKSLLLLLFLLIYPRSRPRPHFTYTKNLRYQNQHGMDLHGQSAICLFCFGPRVAFFPNRSRGPTSNRRIFHFLNFLKFYSCQLCFCLCLPVSHFFPERAPWAHKQSSCFTVFPKRPSLWVP